MVSAVAELVSFRHSNLIELTVVFISLPQLQRLQRSPCFLGLASMYRKFSVSGLFVSMCFDKTNFSLLFVLFVCCIVDFDMKLRSSESLRQPPAPIMTLSTALIAFLIIVGSFDVLFGKRGFYS